MRRIQTLPRTGSLAVALALLATSALGTARAQTGEAPQTGLAPDGLAKYVPSEGLFFYAEFQGFGAYPDAWKQTAAHKIVHDTKTGAMLDEIVTQVAEKALAARPNRRLTGADVAALVRHGLERGMVLGFYNTSAAPSGKAGVIVIRDAFAEEIRPVVAKLLAETGLVGPGVKLVEKSGRRIALDPDDAESGWWIEADRDLVIAERIDPILAVIDGQKPGAAESPERRALVAADGGFRPVGVAFFQVEGNLPASPQISQLGIDGLKKVSLRWGFEGDAIRTETIVDAPRPRKGLLALLDQPAFTLGDLPPMPEGTEEFTAFSLDPAASYDALLATARAAGGEEAAKPLLELETAFRQKTRKDLKEDVLSKLGPKAVAYIVPGKKTGGLGSALTAFNPLAGLQVPRFVMMVELKDTRVFTGTLTELMSVVNKELADAPLPGNAPAAPGAPNPPGGNQAKKPQGAEFRMTSPKPVTYLLSLPTQLQALTNLKLTVAVGEKHLIVAAAPDLAREALEMEAKGDATWAPTGPVQQTLDGLPTELIYLKVDDPSDTLPEALTTLPATLQQTIAAIGAGRAAAARAMAANSGPGGPPPGAPGAGPGGNPPGDDEEARQRPGGGRGFRGAGGAIPSPGTAAGGPSPGAAGGAIPSPGTAGGGPSPGAAGGPPGAPGGNTPPGADVAAALSTLQIEIPSDKMPDPKAVAALLFPGATAIRVDDQGLTMISRQAFPDLGSQAAGASTGALMPVILKNASPPAAPPGAPRGPGAPGGGGGAAVP